MNIQQEKEKLRQEFLKQRQEISEEDFRAASAAIIKKLQQLTEFKKAENVHMYISMNDRGEVDTHGFIKKMVASPKKVVVPVTNMQRGTLTNIRLNSYADLKKNEWGVLEPEGGEEVSTEELDLVVVPMVAADESCNRIGYGKGFYDRFLKDADCPKVGVVFERNLVKQLPTEDFDIPLDKIITEQRVISRD